jgi:hypothetical protein
MNEDNETPEEEDYPIVVCTDCRNIQDASRVMASAWYKDGKMPPCQRCGGVTMEILNKQYSQFVYESEHGKPFI